MKVKEAKSVKIWLPFLLFFKRKLCFLQSLFQYYFKFHNTNLNQLQPIIHQLLIILLQSQRKFLDQMGGHFGFCGAEIMEYHHLLVILIYQHITIMSKQVEIYPINNGMTRDIQFQLEMGCYCYVFLHLYTFL